MVTKNTIKMNSITEMNNNKVGEGFPMYLKSDTGIYVKIHNQFKYSTITVENNNNTTTVVYSLSIRTGVKAHEVNSLVNAAYLQKCTESDYMAAVKRFAHYGNKLYNELNK